MSTGKGPHAPREASLLSVLMRSTPAHVEALRLPEDALSNQYACDVLSAIYEAADVVRSSPERWDGRISPTLVKKVLLDRGHKWMSDLAEWDYIAKAEGTVYEKAIWTEVRKRHVQKQAREMAAALSAASSESYEAALDALAAVQAYQPPSVSGNGRAHAKSAHATATAMLDYMRGAEGKPFVDVPMIGPALCDVVPGSLCILGGDTGTGKSSLMLFVAIAYEKAGRKVGIISLEDPTHIWGDRVQAHFSGYSLLSAIRRQWRPNGDEMDAVAKAIKGLESTKITVSCMPSNDIASIIDEMRAMAIDGCEVIMIDYAQEITDDRFTDDRRLLVTSATIAAKKEAAKHGIMLFLGSQLSRSNSNRTAENEPNEHALKESGDLENKAELIILLWKNWRDKSGQTLGKVAKNKSSHERPRFVVERSKAGSIENLIELHDQVQETAPPAAPRAPSLFAAKGASHG